MSKIKAIGECFEVNKEGFFESPCSFKKIDSPWLEVLEKAKSAYLENLGENLHSIYVRGSVARGTAVKEVSDIDTFAVLNRKVSKSDTAWIKAEQLKLNEPSSFHTGVEFGLGSLQDIIGDNANLQARFLIKLQTVCLWGEDLGLAIPEFKPGAYLASGIHNIEKNVQMAIDGLIDWDEPEAIKEMCQWIMKQIVRTGFLLVAERESTYTRDLYPSFKLFSKNYSKHQTEMETALKLAIYPSSDKVMLINFLRTFGAWLIAEVSFLYPIKSETLAV